MIRFSVHLPTKHRIDIKLVKPRVSLDDAPIIPSIGKVLRARAGNKLSRFFRHIFEHKKVKKVFGGYLAIAILGASLIQVKSVAGSEIPSTSDLQSPIVLTTQQGVQFPVYPISITQGYGFFHPGLDLDGITGDPVRPIMRGKVIKIEISKFAYGKSIIVDHGNGFSSRYAHLSKINVTDGQDVTKDTIIGLMGSTGHSSGDHLHLEVYQDGKTINPLSILPK